MREGDVCLLQEADAFRADWRLCVVEEVYADAKGNVRNVEVKVMNKQNGSSSYKPGQPNYLKRHVNHLILLVPVEEEDEGHADGQLPDVPAQAVQEVHDVSAQSVKEVHDQNDVAAATTQQPRSASQDFNEEHSQVPRQEDDEALTQPCQVNEELDGECSRGRRKTTRVTRSTAAARH